MNFQFNSPDLCACCGDQKPSTPWELSQRDWQQRDSKSMFGLIGITASMISYPKVTFKVPVCNNCLPTMNSRASNLNFLKTIAWGVFIVGILILVGAIIMAISGTSSSPRRADLLSPNVFGLLLFLFFIGVTVGNGLLFLFQSAQFSGLGLAMYDGTYFKFKNTRFHAAFAKLNPELVRGHKQNY